jgi:hypothetical protein
VITHGTSYNVHDKLYHLYTLFTTLDFETFEEAKAAAQADYETRILSALEP